MDFGFIAIIFCLGILAQITLGKIVQIDNDVTYDNGGTQWFSTLKKRPIDAFLGKSFWSIIFYGSLKVSSDIYLY